ILGQDRINTAAAVNNEWIALATTKNGVNIIDLKGHLIQSFSKKEGIQNNNVLSVLLDNQGNLWMGLDNGIDCIAINSAIKLLNPNSQDASIYTARIFNNRLYAGTSSGLYSVELQQIPDLSYSKGSFVPVANASGQAWGLSEINGKLLLAHHEGAYEVSDNSATRITPYLGFWNFVPMSSVFPTASIVSGTYKGLSFLDYRNNHFTESFKVPGFSETSRFVALDRFNNIWVSHPYHGVYKVTRTDGNNFITKLYTQSNGLPSSLNNHVFKIKGDVLVASEKGIYTYNTEKDNFEYSPLYGELFGKQSLRYLKEDEDGNIWFIHEKNVGIADMSAHPPKLIYLPELNRKMLSGFEFIYPVDSKNIFMGGEKGLFHINYDQYKKNSRDIIVQLRSVKITDNLDSLLFGGYFWNVNEIQQQGKNQVPNIENRWKTIHFEFSSPEFGQKANLEYSFRLEGFNDKWSDWSGKTEKEYTNLPGGNYQFEIKARNNLGKESGVYAYAFIFQPPWYQTTWAYFIYTIIFIISVYLIYRAQRKKFLRQQIKYEQEQKNFLYLHQLEINKAESELVTLRNEKLQAEIDYKNSELANSAMHLVHKGELLTKLKTELSQTMKMIDNNEGKTEMKKMIKVLTEDDKMDKDWEDFAQHFDKVHSDFIVGLKEQFPKLTSNELKLSAYLRMNLSTKKIAQLMSISVRGVEISRYRLRKKLEIPTGASLFDFLMQLRF
ncbi:MAG: triple tyrosine motif-containing protein, partial [Ferruginibacter sp.]